MPYVYSTITNDTYYCEYFPSEKGAPRNVKKKVLVKGGTGLATKHLVTPMGVVTNISDSDMDFLKSNAAFQRHMVAGFIKIDDKKVDPEVVAADMEIGDGSSPIVPQDFATQSDENNGVINAKPADCNASSIAGKIGNKLKG